MIPNIEDQQKGYSIRASLNQVIAWVNDAATYIAGLITDAIAVHDTDGAAHADIREAIETETTDRQTGDASTLSSAAQDAASKVATHNTDAATHADIRTLISQANAAIASGDAATLQSAQQALTNAVSEHNMDASAHADIRALIATINALIPSQATPGNQLADKDFVNSSLNAVAAHRLSFNAAGDRFPTKADLTNATTFYYNGESLTPTENDYTLVAADESQNGAEVRYRYTGSQWVIDYIVNDTPFTDAQNKAINSGMTAELTDKLASPDAAPTQNSAKLVTSGGVWSWFGGALSSLTTTAKTVIGAINELVTSKVDSATVGDVAVTKSGTTLQIPAYPTSLPANGGNADTLGGNSASAFAAAAHTHTKSAITDFPTSMPANGGNADTLQGNAASAFANASHTHTKAAITDFPASMPANGGNADTVGGATLSDIYTIIPEADWGTWYPMVEGTGYGSRVSKFALISSLIFIETYINIYSESDHCFISNLPEVPTSVFQLSVKTFNSNGEETASVAETTTDGRIIVYSMNGIYFSYIYIHSFYGRYVFDN